MPSNAAGDEEKIHLGKLFHHQRYVIVFELTMIRRRRGIAARRSRTSSRRDTGSAWAGVQVGGERGCHAGT